MQQDTNGSQCAQRLLDVLEAAASCPQGMGITELACATGLAKSTVHRLSSVLLERHYLDRDDFTGKLTCGHRLIALAGDSLSSLDIRTVALPLLRDLAQRLHVTAHIAVRSADMAVYIEKLEPYTLACPYSEIGRRIELYCSSLGKALLLGMDAQEYAQYLQGLSITAFTGHTVKSADELDAQIQLARKTHITFDVQEHEPGVFCAGSPVFDAHGAVMAAVSISSREESLLTDDAALKLLKECAFKISERFGYTQ